MSARRRGRAAEALVLATLAVIIGTASAQTYSTIEECITDYVKQFNLTDVDAKAKCATLFSVPSTPVPLPPFTPPPPASDPVLECIARLQREKGLGYDEAKRLCVPSGVLSSPVPVPGAVPVSGIEACVALHMKEKGLSFEEAKRVCAGIATPSTSPDPATQNLLDCIARTQKEKGLGYDEAKRLCYAVSGGQAGGAGVAVAATAADCVARTMKEKGVGEEAARRACATVASGANAFEECVLAAVEGKGLSKEEAARACGNVQSRGGRSTAVNVEGCIEKHVQGGLSKEEAARACASMGGAAEALPPHRRVVAREIVEKLKERVREAPNNLRGCVKEVREMNEKCAQAGKSPRECRAEVAQQMRQACPILDASEAGSSACMAKCGQERESCLASKSEEMCQKEGFACLSGCPEMVGRLATLAMKAERFHGLRVNPEEARALDENRNPLEVFAGAMEVKKAAARPPEAPGGPAAAAPGAPAEPGVPARRELVLSLPVKLAAGKRLAAFQHEASGISLEQGELSIPMKAGAEIAAHIRAKVREAVGRDQAAEMAVERLMMETKAYEADLSDQRPLVGKVLAKLAADLKDMPENAEVKVTPLAVLAEEKRKAVEEEVKRRGLKVKEVAYAMEVEHKNLASAVEKANVTMTVSRKWVEAQGGPEKVRIHREADDGRRELLETVFLGYDGDNAVFEGVSRGLSVFSLVAVEEGEATTPVPTPAPKRSPGFEAGLALAALLALGLLARRRRD